MALEPGHWSHCAHTPSAASWVTGYGVRGLASPHPFLGATPLAGDKSGSGECGLLPGAARGGRHGVVWLLQVAGWRTWCVGVPSPLWSSLLLGGERSRCASCSCCGRLCVHTAHVPAVLRERGGASDAVLDRVLGFQLYYSDVYVQCKLCTEASTCSACKLCKSRRFHSTVLVRLSGCRWCAETAEAPQ